MKSYYIYQGIGLVWLIVLMLHFKGDITAPWYVLWVPMLLIGGLFAFGGALAIADTCPKSYNPDKYTLYASKEYIPEDSAHKYVIRAAPKNFLKQFFILVMTTAFGRPVRGGPIRRIERDYSFDGCMHAHNMLSFDTQEAADQWLAEPEEITVDQGIYVTAASKRQCEINHARHDIKFYGEMAEDYLKWEKKALGNAEQYEKMAAESGDSDYARWAVRERESAERHRTTVNPFLEKIEKAKSTLREKGVLV